MKLSKLTIQRSLKRALHTGIVGMATAFVLIPVDLSNPKRFLQVLGTGLAVGFIHGLQKCVSGYLKYDRVVEKKKK